MQTYHCRHCGQVLAAFVTGAPGLALPFAQNTAMHQVQTRRQEHLERCPALHLRAAS